MAGTWRAEPWRGRGSLTRRILAVNLIALLLTTGALFYLDNFRVRLIEERRAQAEGEAQIAAAAINAAPRRARPALIETLGRRSGDRLRLFDSNARQLLDSWDQGPRTYGFDTRAGEPWDNEAARAVDRAIEQIVGANVPQPFSDAGKNGHDWPELVSVIDGATVASRVWLAPDRTLMITAATAVNAQRSLFVISVGNARDVTRLVRAERFRLAMIVLGTLLLTIALSLFLARTIVRPLRALAQAAVQVRLGRARDVVVPRLPERSDEIGMLARAVSDMTQALRERIDATEAFAADVAHELKNPLASMASAVQSLSKTSNPETTRQLHEILGEDVRRLDRAITDISELSRLDGELSRTRFQRVDIAALLSALIDGRMRRQVDSAACLTLLPTQGRLDVLGDPSGLARAIDNLIDNALSFSPPGSTVRVTAESADGAVEIVVEDEGPGVPLDQREAIFARFHSDRPAEPFARHSGLGLAIVRTIVDAHNGNIVVSDARGQSGARFVVQLPAA